MTAIDARRQDGASSSPRPGRTAKSLHSGLTPAISRCGTSRFRSARSTSSATRCSASSSRGYGRCSPSSPRTRPRSSSSHHGLGAAAHARAFRGNGLRGLYEYLLPAHITSLAVNMLLYANNQFWPVMFGVVVGEVSGEATCCRRRSPGRCATS